MSSAPKPDASHPGKIVNLTQEPRLGRFFRLARQDYSSFVRLVEQIREDYRVNHRDWTMPGFRAVAVHRIGTWVRGLWFRPVRAIVTRIYRLLYVYIRNHYTIELPGTTEVGRRLTIGHQGGIVIHPWSKIGDDCITPAKCHVGSCQPRDGQARAGFNESRRGRLWCSDCRGDRHRRRCPHRAQRRGHDECNRPDPRSWRRRRASSR